MHDIARNLKRLRRQAGLTQEELAEKLHVTRQAVSNWERNQNLPELEVLLAAAEALGASVDELLYGPRPEARPGGPESRPPIPRAVSRRETTARLSPSKDNKQPPAAKHKKR